MECDNNTFLAFVIHNFFQKMQFVSTNNFFQQIFKLSRNISRPSEHFAAQLKELRGPQVEERWCRVRGNWDGPIIAGSESGGPITARDANWVGQSQQGVQFVRKYCCRNHKNICWKNLKNNCKMTVSLHRACSQQLCFPENLKACSREACTDVASTSPNLLVDNARSLSALATTSL